MTGSGYPTFGDEIHTGCCRGIWNYDSFASVRSYCERERERHLFIALTRAALGLKQLKNGCEVGAVIDWFRNVT